MNGKPVLPTDPATWPREAFAAGAESLRHSIIAMGPLLTGGANQRHHLECAARDVFVHMAEVFAGNVPTPGPLGYEAQVALREGHSIAAAEAYFEARPDQDTPGARRIFDAGFTRGFAARESLP